jgi:hypothetical protein
MRRNQFPFNGDEMRWRMRRNQITSYCLWNVMVHAQNPDFVLLGLKYNGKCAVYGFRFTGVEIWSHMSINQICLTSFEIWWHMRRNQIRSYGVWNVMAHAQKTDLVRLGFTCNGICAETRFRLTGIEIWWHKRRKQIKTYLVWNMMAHAQKPDFVLLGLICKGTYAETRFSLTGFEIWWHLRRNQI